jgi:hypothetical protein
MSEITSLSINKALLDAEGNFDIAAASLDLTVERLRDRVKEDAALNTRWLANAAAPPSTAILNRESDPAIIEALQREESKIKSGLEKMGLTQNQTGVAVACMGFYKQHFASLLNLTGGGLAKTVVEALESVSEMGREIKEIGKPTLPQDLEYLKALLRARSDLQDYILRASTMVNQSLLILAKVQNISGAGRRAAGPGRPGFDSVRRADVTETE